MGPQAFMGIDPGVSGGIAIIGMSDGKPTVFDSWPMRSLESLADLWDVIYHSSDTYNLTCFVEKVGGYVGGVGQPGSMMFTFGKSYGSLLAFLVAAQIPYEEIPPQRW